MLKLIISIVILIILIIIGIILIQKINNNDETNKIENFGDDLDVRKDNVSYVNITEQFPDIKKFENDKDFRMGLDKCIEYKEKEQNNKGNCVEYGITGNAWYYPQVNYKYNNYHSNQSKDFKVINEDKRNVDEPINAKLKFVYR